MRKVFKFFVFGLLLFALPVRAQTMPTVTVMADHSLSVVVAEIARNYSRQKKASVNTSFLSQKIQQEQISEGAEADILITSKLAWIEDLKLQGLTDIYSQSQLASDRLVLVSSPETFGQIHNAGRFPLVDIIKMGAGEPNFILGNPETLMEGVYSKEAVRKLGVANDLEQVTLYIKNQPQMLEMASRENMFAICFKSTVAGRDDVKTIYNIPESAHKPIIYYAVVIAGDNMNQARNFLDYLKSGEVNKTFRKYGFNAD